MTDPKCPTCNPYKCVIADPQLTLIYGCCPMCERKYEPSLISTREQALDELTAQAQEMGLYDDLEAPPGKRIANLGPFPFGPIPHWIKCSDNPPPEDQWILGANSTRVEMGVYLGKEKGFTLPQYNYMCLEITHWMPLPLPPND